MEFPLKKTPLYQEHLKLGAKIVPFGGWDMPVQYQGILEEYQSTREGVSIFDICHMGEFILEGNVKNSGLDRLVTMSLEDLPVKSCRYGAMLNDQGGVIDDLIVFRLNEEKWFLVVNASCIEKDAQHIQAHLKDNAVFQDVSSETGKIDIQGPWARDVLVKFVEDIDKLDYYTFDFFNLLGENVLISRTGYTGELGYEIYYPSRKIEHLWQELLKDKRVKPAGLGARDLLRLEVGYSLYGHELNEDISVLESGLSRFIDFEKDFIGKEALCKDKEMGALKKIVGFVSDTRRTPRAEQKVFNNEGEAIGFVTSGCFSPYLKKGIGLALVGSDTCAKETKICFGEAHSKNSGVVSGKIFYKNGSLKN